MTARVETKDWTFEKYVCIAICVVLTALAFAGAVESYAKAKYSRQCECATEITPAPGQEGDGDE